MYSRARIRWPIALIVFAGCAFTIYMVYQHTLADPNVLRWNSWAYSELLINYEAGFVRRGLIGHLLLHTGSSLFVINHFVFATAVLVTALVASNAIYVGLRSKSLIAVGLCFMLPGGLISMSQLNQYYFRKEVLFISFVYLLVFVRRWAARQSETTVLGTVIAWSAVSSASAALMLVHEAFMFMAAPAVVLIMRDWCNSYRATMTATYATILGIIFLFNIIYKGNTDVVHGIWASLSAADRGLISKDGTPAGGIGALGWSFVQGLKLPLSVLLSGAALYWLMPVLLSATAVATYSALVASDTRRGFARGLILYGALLVGVGPLFALGWDWGRWIASVNMTCLALLPTLEALPDRLERWSATLSERIELDCRSAALLGFAIIMASAFFSLPECCIGVGDSTPLRAFLKGMVR